MVGRIAFAYITHPNLSGKTVHNKRSTVSYRTQAGNSANARVCITYFNSHVSPLRTDHKIWVDKLFLLKNERGISLAFLLWHPSWSWQITSWTGSHPCPVPRPPVTKCAGCWGVSFSTPPCCPSFDTIHLAIVPSE